MESEKVKLLEMKDISKSFPGVKALNKVHLEIYKGEVHALLGENGAGKSTLIKILAGIYKADEGEILIDGSRIDINGVNIAISAGISVIHQELCLASNMTVAENIFMGREPKSLLGTVNEKKMIGMAQEILNRNGLSINAKDKVGSLTVAQQQMVEVAKALSFESRIIVMDEPTASLSEKEVKKLFEAIENLKQKGVAIIYISHRLEELYAICDRVTVLRDGEYIDTCLIKEIEPKQLISMMVGRELADFFDKPSFTGSEKILEVSGVSAGKKLSDAEFFLYKGEILGFYGLVGSGRTELMRVLFGIDRPTSGEIKINGKRLIIKSPEEAIEHGLALVPEDRKQQGAVLGQTVSFNITLPVLKEIYRWFKVDKKLKNKIVEDYVSRLRIKISSMEQVMGNLSGGNQQKVIIGKWLATNPKILILDEPTRGIDVGAKKEIYHIMNRLVESGISIIMVSSDLPEIVNMSNRVITMCNGRTSGILEGDSITQENIIIRATGGLKNVH